MVYYPIFFLVLLLVGWLVGEEITIPYYQWLFGEKMKGIIAWDVSDHYKTPTQSTTVWVDFPITGAAELKQIHRKKQTPLPLFHRNC